MQILVFLVKRLVMAICLLYAFDLITSGAGVMVPINSVSILFVAVLGIPAIIGLVILEKMI